MVDILDCHPGEKGGEPLKIKLRSRAALQCEAIVPRTSLGGKDILINDLFDDSRGKSWIAMKSRGTKKLGRELPHPGKMVISSAQTAILMRANLMCQNTMTLHISTPQIRKAKKL